MTGYFWYAFHAHSTVTLRGEKKMFFFMCDWLLSRDGAHYFFQIFFQRLKKIIYSTSSHHNEQEVTLFKMLEETKTKHIRRLHSFHPIVPEELFESHKEPSKIEY